MTAFSARLDQIRNRIHDAGAQAALVTHLPDIRWAIGFTGSNGLLVVTEKEAHFVTDGRYDAQAQREVGTATVHIPGYKLAEHVATERLFGGARSVVVQGDHLTVAALDRWKGLLPEVDWISEEDWLAETVAAKDEAAVEAVAAAQALTCEVFEAVLPFIAPGVTEQAIAAEVVYQHLRRGASTMSFEPIVAAGPHGALPHARPSTRAIQAGDLVVLDMGGVLDGYCSDLTRTVAVEEPGEVAREVYEAVRRANRSAIDAVRGGVSGAEVDAAARAVLDEAGYGDYFTHSTGHGVGIEVHEWPRLSSQADHTLPPGATVTVEPGVYLPERFGVRIEDLVVVREDGCDSLTPLATDLLVL